MNLMKWEKDGSCAVIRMANGENRHSLAFYEKLIGIIDDILADREIFSIVLTSSDEKNFSQGIDLQWLMGIWAAKDYDTVKKFLYTMNDLFRKLLLCPVPVIAAINGHCAGNGAIMACACDFRFMRSDRGYFFFPEVDISIPFFPGMIEIVRKAIPYYKFEEMKLTGRKITAPELEEHHAILKSAAGSDEVIKISIEYAKTFAKKRGIFGEIKKRMNRNIIEVMEKDDPAYFESMNILVKEEGN